MKFSLRQLLGLVLVWCLFLGTAAALGPPQLNWFGGRALSASVGERRLLYDTGTGTLWAQTGGPADAVGGYALLPLGPLGWGIVAGSLGLGVCVWRYRRPVV